MNKFRKKPVVIEAGQLAQSNAAELAAWCGGRVFNAGFECLPPIVAGIEIVTPEGTMTANIGDWIIEGVKGEFYPCKPDIFAATYEAAEGEDYP